MGVQPTLTSPTGCSDPGDGDKGYRFIYRAQHGHSRLSSRKPWRYRELSICGKQACVVLHRVFRSPSRSSLPSFCFHLCHFVCHPYLYSIKLGVVSFHNSKSSQLLSTLCKLCSVRLRSPVDFHETSSFVL
ncbi:hypothetical protein M3J09_004063 [Ascochyta lentis]